MKINKIMQHMDLAILNHHIVLGDAPDPKTMKFKTTPSVFEAIVKELWSQSYYKRYIVPISEVREFRYKGIELISDDYMYKNKYPELRYKC